jgi:hypothetical protein
MYVLICLSRFILKIWLLSCLLEEALTVSLDWKFLATKTKTRGHKKSGTSCMFIILIEIDLGNPQNVWNYLMGTSTHVYK